jgi:hypothetical protein
MNRKQRDVQGRGCGRAARPSVSCAGQTECAILLRDRSGTEILRIFCPRQRMANNRNLQRQPILRACGWRPFRSFQPRMPGIKPRDWREGPLPSC